jgi:cohesin loading factor subunit SCC2
MNPTATHVLVKAETPTTESPQGYADPQPIMSPATESAALGTSQSSGTPGKLHKIAVQLPHAPSFNRDEYQKITVPDEPEEPSALSMQKRKREEIDGLGQSLGHQERSIAAYTELQRCMHDAFHSEDYLLNSRQANDWAYFVLDDDVTLSSSVQRKLHSLLEKCIELRCYKEVPLEDLLHIIRLSEGALKHASGLDPAVDGGWGPQDVEQWLQYLPEIDTGLKAARTILRMMCGSREEKQLYSEERIEHTLDLLRRVLDGVIVPLAELRNTGEAFKLLSQQKAQIGHLLTTFQKVFSLMTTLIAMIDTSESVTNTLETLATRLVFVETAHSEKESVMETHRFDGLRLVAMDMLSQLFLLNPALRQGIFNEILTSLEKLPVGKQRARQFKLADATSIQPVSALIMRLVQTSAGKEDESKGTKRAMTLPSMKEDVGDDQRHSGTGRSHGAVFTVHNEWEGGKYPSRAISELQDTLKPLMESVTGNASYVVNFIVTRALKSTKTGDTPYRNLLDLFVEDFTACLNNPEWPAAELLLRFFTITMVNLVEDHKSPAPAKNMALEVLGVITAAISRIRSYVRKAASALDTSEGGDLGRYLAELGLSALELKCRPELLVSWSGPYRATLEYLQTRYSEDPHLASAITFLTTLWAHKLGTNYDAAQEDDDEQDRTSGQLAYRLRMMIFDKNWLANEYSFANVSIKHARLAYATTLLGCQLCESFSLTLNILLKSMASDQATVRSKSLKSIDQVLETDPSILDGDSVVIQLILQCCNDSSTQVRDSALTLVGKCIEMRPALEMQMIETVIDRFPDTGPGVRKRAMKLAKVIYLRNSNKSMRSRIAFALLFRVQDPEEGVRDLALQMIEEIWFAPFYGGETSAASKISLAEHVALMVQTVKQGNVSNVLDKVLETLLSPKSKSAAMTLEVCSQFVETLFDMVDNGESEDASVPSGRDALQVLMTFAKADASLFTFEQIRLLKPQIENLAAQNYAVGRAVIVIYRRVLPRLSKAHTHFLEHIFETLLKTLQRNSRLLDDVFACLWILSQLVGGIAMKKLATLASSSLQHVKNIATVGPQQLQKDAENQRKFAAYCTIVGHAGKHCDLDSHVEIFRSRIPEFKGISVSRLMVDLLAPFAARSWPPNVRKASLDAVGLVCQSWPKNYNASIVYRTFHQIFDEQNSVLETIILQSLKEFLLVEEKRSEEASKETGNKATDAPQTRELTVMGGTSHDDVASGTAQRFLKEITRISLATQDAQAFLATEVLASINRQGLVHPKETGVTFITLETSSVPEISSLAYKEHKSLHEKHETVLEREYVRAFQAAFAYQRDVVKDARGATANPYVAKMHLMMDILKVSRSKNRQRFLEKLCTQVDFDFPKLDVSEEIPFHVQYSRFVLENIAFFDYNTVGELQATVAAMEKLFSTTGAPVAHAIECEVFQMRMDTVDAEAKSEIQAVTDGRPAPEAPTVDIGRLRHLTAASMVLLALWEARTHLRRVHGMGTARRDPKAKTQAKDLNKTPTRVQGVTGDRFWDEMTQIMTGLATRERMVETCKTFVELMNVDKELKIADEEEELNGDGPTTPINEDENDDDDEASQPGGRGRKRKAANTPSGRKKRARSSSQPRKRGRPRKQTTITVDADADADGDGEWF